MVGYLIEQSAQGSERLSVTDRESEKRERQELRHKRDRESVAQFRSLVCNWFRSSQLQSDLVQPSFFVHPYSQAPLLLKHNCLLGY